jgi:AcrR family transcriptional regulator
MSDTRARRSGAALESALLDAAWDELVETGYGRFTMGRVASRARTSEPVLYRRWPNKDQLVLAALERQRARHPVEAPDTGSLRGDLVGELAAAGETLVGFYPIAVATSLSGLLADTGLTPAEVRDQLLDAEHRDEVRPLYRRAATRGELDLDRVPRTVLEMPFDLVRHDLLMRFEAPDAERIRSIVDDLFLPAVDAAR